MRNSDLAHLHRQALVATRKVIAGIKPSRPSSPRYSSAKVRCRRHVQFHNLVDACLEIVRPQSAMFVGSGMFGDGGTSALGEKSPQRELLKLLGRTP